MKKYGYISDLYVEEGYRGRGISTGLKDGIIEWFKGKNVDYAAIGFYASNSRAHSVYNEWGFFDYKIEARKKI